jgi:hypothetical protein
MVMRGGGAPGGGGVRWPTGGATADFFIFYYASFEWMESSSEEIL